MSILYTLNGDHWDNALAELEQRIRLSRAEGPAPEPEFPEAEIGDSERRAAMIRERLRRQGLRR